jgi:hypothetical protein
MGARGRGSGGRDGRMPPGSYPGGYRQRDVPMSPAAAGEAPGAPQESPTVRGAGTHVTVLALVPQ